MVLNDIHDTCFQAPPAPKRFPHMGHSRNPSAASGISFCSMISEPISEMPPDGMYNMINRYREIYIVLSQYSLCRYTV